MQFTLGLTNTESVVLIIGFVFSYIFMGGTYAHAYTNTLQGIIMVVIASVIVASGFPLLAEGFGAFFDQIAAVNPNLVEAINPQSPLYGSLFSVWIAGFVIGFALVCQPHILTKALYVKTDKAVLQYLLVSTAVSLVFTGLLLVGLYAHVADIPPAAFLDPVTGFPKADAVVTVYIAETFSPVMRSVIAVALMAAGMSTLDGILVALSSITANDLFLNITENNLLKTKTPEEKGKLAHRASQIILILLGITTLVISLYPPELLSIFGQIGVFGIAAASAAPIFFGIFVVRMPKAVVFSASVASLSIYISLFLWGDWAMRNQANLVEIVSDWGPLRHLFDTGMYQLGLLNPAVPATYGVIASFIIATPWAVRSWIQQRAAAAEPVAEA